VGDDRRLFACKEAAWLCRVAINKAVDDHHAGSWVEPGAYPNDTANQSPSAEQTALTRMQAGPVPEGD
jgi:hypothetical protein